MTFGSPRPSPAFQRPHQRSTRFEEVNEPSERLPGYSADSKSNRAYDGSKSVPFPMPEPHWHPDPQAPSVHSPHPPPFAAPIKNQNVLGRFVSSETFYALDALGRALVHDTASLLPSMVKKRSRQTSVDVKRSLDKRMPSKVTQSVREVRDSVHQELKKLERWIDEQRQIRMQRQMDPHRPRTTPRDFGDRKRSESETSISSIGSPIRGVVIPPPSPDSIYSGGVKHAKV